MKQHEQEVITFSTKQVERKKQEEKKGQPSAWNKYA